MRDQNIRSFPAVMMVSPNYYSYIRSSKEHQEEFPDNNHFYP